MFHPARSPHERHPRRLRRSLLLVLMVPALIFGPAFASGVMLLHSHGPDGLHGHVLPAGLAVDTHAHEAHAWHANEHAGHALDSHAAHVDEHGHDLLHDSLHGHVPPGSLTQLPSAVWPHLANSRTTVALARMLSLEGSGASLPPTLENTCAAPDHLPRSLRLWRPARASHGSGASRVLQLSHALLI